MAHRRELLTGAGLILLAAGLWLAGWPVRGSVTAEDAAELVRRELDTWGAPDLAPKEVMEFTNHFYVLVVEKSTGKGAVELLVDRNGFVYPEPGPNMMWNTKYGPMGGWMGPAFRLVQPDRPVSFERARQLAEQFLRQVPPGATPGHGTEFYGYFTFHVERDGKILGMLSVSAYTGQVWEHTWHGPFVRKIEL